MLNGSICMYMLTPVYVHTIYAHVLLIYVHTGEPEPSYYIYDGLQVVSAATGVGSYTQRTEYDMHRYYTTLYCTVLYYAILYYIILK